MVINKILPPSKNIIKSWSTEIDIFGKNFRPNTLTFLDLFLLIYCDGRNISKHLIPSFQLAAQTKLSRVETKKVLLIVA
jgi:hypothetical protein